MVMIIREMEIREEARTEGKSEGITEINALSSYLISENWLDDLWRATTDPAYQAKLLHEFSLLQSSKQNIKKKKRKPKESILLKLRPFRALLLS